MKPTLPLLALALTHALALAGCASAGPATAPPASVSRGPVVLSLVATNDLHGRLALLPWLAGHVRIVRELRAHDGAAVLLDAGDMFQGTVESNLNEGAAVIAAYNAMGYAAAALGNHEFDYGPEGAATFARAPSDDARGALRARAREAHFPFLSANIVRDPGGAEPGWDNVRPSTMLEVAGVHLGLVGVSTESTPSTTLTVNFRGLAMRPLAETITTQARALRARGADAIVVLAHAGGRCTHFEQPEELSSCQPDEELFQVARALPPGLVDVIVAGHTHQAVAHVVNGIALVESYAMGRAFGRVELTVDPAAHRVLSRVVHPPRAVCGDLAREEPAPESCAPAPYEGRAVQPDPAVAAVIAPALEAARAVRERSLGVQVLSPVRTAYARESALPNLLADLVLAATPGAAVGLMNAGGVRVDLPAGPLTYGQLYAALPFDNRVVTIRVRASGLAEYLAHNAGGGSGALSVAGVRARVRCAAGHLVAELSRDDGRAIAPDEVLAVATNDFLARGAMARFGLEPVSDDAVVAGPVLRDALEAGLRRLSPLRGDDVRWFDAAHPRIELPGERPVHCAP